MGQGEWSKSANKVHNRCVCPGGEGISVGFDRAFYFSVQMDRVRSKWTGFFASYYINFNSLAAPFPNQKKNIFFGLFYSPLIVATLI